MYLVLVFADPKQRHLISLCLFDSIKDIIYWSKNLLRYSDMSKIKRVYRSYKSFFAIRYVSVNAEIRYFMTRRRRWQKTLRPY